MNLTDSNIVRQDETTVKYCPGLADGEVCKMTHQDALDYCREQGGHLPSTRELALFMNPGAVLEQSHVDTVLHGKVPDGYYKVAGEDQAGNIDVFYYNNSLPGRTLSGQLATLSFWTATFVQGKRDYAHVFYGPLGGGGGPAEEHARTYKHAVLLVRTQKRKGFSWATLLSRCCSWSRRTAPSGQVKLLEYGLPTPGDT